MSIDDRDGYEAAQDTKMYEREQELREEGKWPLRRHLFSEPVAEAPVLGTARGKLSVSPDFNAPMVLDTDENGDPRGRWAVLEGIVGRSLDDLPDVDHDAFGETERARPDDHDEAVIRATVQLAEGPMALVPAGELALAAVQRVVDALRGDTGSARTLSTAHGAAQLARISLDRLFAWVENALHERARRFPKECCACGRDHDEAAWAKLQYVGTGGDPSDLLEMRQCVCQSTLAMPANG